MITKLCLAHQSIIISVTLTRLDRRSTVTTEMCLTQFNQRLAFEPFFAQRIVIISNLEMLNQQEIDQN